MTTRRTVLLGAGAVVGVTALAACGNGSSGAAKPTNFSGPIAKTSDIPVGGGKIFSDQQVVVTQPTDGAFKAFSAVCTHQGCIVGQVANGEITCPCHGSQYSIVDGSVTHAAQAGQAALPAKQISVANGEITVS